ncbi:hypothetical protein COO60DRAFT_92209 [Scenedesmus sp. NREL 46B-D3]|nr:hypothetical protein COO60DRAFT_92209 [Scenedesmus sp. NREL 46B-D3]
MLWAVVCRPAPAITSCSTAAGMAMAAACHFGCACACASTGSNELQHCRLRQHTICKGCANLLLYPCMHVPHCMSAKCCRQLSSSAGREPVDTQVHSRGRQFRQQLMFWKAGLNNKQQVPSEHAQSMHWCQGHANQHLTVDHAMPRQQHSHSVLYCGSLCIKVQTINADIMVQHQAPHDMGLCDCTGANGRQKTC